LQSNFLITLNGRAGVSVRLLSVAKIVVRLVLAAVFLSIVASLTGPSPVRWIATFMEIVVALALLIGWQLRWAALLGTVVLVLHAIVIFLSLGPAPPSGYFALAAASAAFLLFAVQPSKLYEKT
jgi:hypothetical protein